jgi:RNA polymerase sigma factor for flagellar operon FliA
MIVAESAEPELWQRYRQNGDQDARDCLFLLHASWATSIARGVHQRVRSYQVDREDFIQNATIGLLEAMSGYDPDRGIPFRGYAQARVRGAVFNGLRAIVGERSTASDETRFSERFRSLQDEQEEGSAFERIVDSIVNLGIGYFLDEAAGHDRGQTSDCLAYAQNSELESRLLFAVAILPHRLKLIIQSHYFHHVPFWRLATQFGLTKGRISQLHKSALNRLRVSLHDME